MVSINYSSILLRVMACCFHSWYSCHMTQTQRLAKQIVTQGADLHELAFEHCIDPLKLELEVALLEKDGIRAAVIEQRLRQKEADEIELNNELCRLREDIRRGKAK